MRKAFTLIELLVVIGILGILITVVTVNFGDARESARALKCLSNLRDLANAATAIGMETKQYPRAGSVFVMSTIGTILDKPCPGWIGFGRDDKTVPYYGTGNFENDIHAITNGGSWEGGLFWKTVKHNRAVYKCPTFVSILSERSHVEPLFTYVMNGAAFRYDFAKGGEDALLDWQSLGVTGGDYYGKMTRADRTLMFAELPHPRRAANEQIDEYTADPILQAKASIQGHVYEQHWIGEPESIGFVHKTNAGKYCAHVVFADCHVEKIAEPSGDGLTGEELSAVLCAGDDYYCEKGAYRLPD